MPRRNRDRRPGRRAPFRDPKPTILVVCEGDTTEPEYLQGLRKAFRNQLVEIHVAPEHGVPLTLVHIAKEYKRNSKRQAKRNEDENLEYNSVWCVFDIDSHPRVGEAKEMARDNGIDLAISNPSFELWLLLHFRESPGMQDRDVIYRMLRDYVEGYDKHVDFIKTFWAGYDQAVIRAERLNDAAEADNDSGRNPTTGVYVLTELICGERSPTRINS